MFHLEMASAHRWELSRETLANFEIQRYTEHMLCYVDEIDDFLSWNCIETVCATSFVSFPCFSSSHTRLLLEAEPD